MPCGAVIMWVRIPLRILDGGEMDRGLLTIIVVVILVVLALYGLYILLKG